MQTKKSMRNRNRYQKFKKGEPMIPLSPIQIIGYVLFCLVLFLSATTFTGCKTVAYTPECIEVDTITNQCFDVSQLKK